MKTMSNLSQTLLASFKSMRASYQGLSNTHHRLSIQIFHRSEEQILAALVTHFSRMFYSYICLVLRAASKLSLRRVILIQNAYK